MTGYFEATIVGTKWSKFEFFTNVFPIRMLENIV